MNERILLVDDQPIIRMIMRDILLDAQYEVVGEARDGREGAHLFRELRPDLVIMDLNMPVVNGFELLEQILAMDDAARVVVCSAMSDQESISRAIKRGARDFVRKPFTQEHLLKVIRKIV